MTLFDNTNAASRTVLANGIIALMAKSKFKAVLIPGTKELVYELPVVGVPNMRVRVYTSIVYTGNTVAVRTAGIDAIRVITMYKAARDGKERPLAKANHKVYRTGEIESITDRVVTRMRECYAVGLTNPCVCRKCGAPTFKSKGKKKKINGKMTVVKTSNTVCAELCWLG